MPVPNINPDQCAVVVDQHTGKVRAQFVGFGAEEDAAIFTRETAGKVEHLSSVSIITGDAARKALKKGRV